MSQAAPARPDPMGTGRRRAARRLGRLLPIASMVLGVALLGTAALAPRPAAPIRAVTAAPERPAPEAVAPTPAPGDAPAPEDAPAPGDAPAPAPAPAPVTGAAPQPLPPAPAAPVPTAAPPAGQQPAPGPVVAAGVLPRARPVAVQITRIGVDAGLVDLALNADRSMQVPDFGSAGWYVHAPTPGELGPAIVAAHVSSRAGPDVFARLHELVAGDEVRVRREDGRTAVFRVDGLERIPKASFPTERVYGDIGHAGLRLITCGGSFDRSSGHFRDNVIVYASLVGTA